MSAIPMISDAQHQALLGGGWESVNKQKCTLQGQVFYRHTYSRAVPCPFRCLRISAFALQMILFTALCCQCSEVCKDKSCLEHYCSNACSGTDKIARYVFNQKESDQLFLDDYGDLGFDPRNKESLRNYYKNNAGKFTSYMGHAHYCYFTKSGASEFIFVPNGDVNSPHIHNMNYCNRKTYQSLGTKRLQEDAERYCENWNGRSSAGSSSFSSNVTLANNEQSECSPLLVNKQPEKMVVMIEVELGS